MVGNIRPILWMLLGAVGFCAALIGCVNVSNLLLARSDRQIARICDSRRVRCGPAGDCFDNRSLRALLLAIAGGALGVGGRQVGAHSSR